jgi:hypothetical protein
VEELIMPEPETTEEAAGPIGPQPATPPAPDAAAPLVIPAEAPDLYYRTDETVEFPAKATVVTLGVDVIQGLIWGFSPDPRWAHVGPGSPAYAAANIAYTRGARKIEISGLSDFYKGRLQPFIDEVTTHHQAPAPDVEIKVS